MVPCFRSLLALLLGLSLSGQTFDTLKRPRTLWVGNQATHLALRTTPQGAKPTLSLPLAQGTVHLELPPGLSPHQSDLTYWEGKAWAQGLRIHPSYARLGVGFPWSEALMQVYCSEDLRTWRLLASYQPRTYQGVGDHQGRPTDPHGIPLRFIPLGNGTFLALGLDWAGFQDGVRQSPFAIFHVGAERRLTFKHLINLPQERDADLEDAIQEAASRAREIRASLRAFGAHRAWIICRTPGGIMVLHRRTGWTFLLDNQDGALVRHALLFPQQRPTTRQVGLQILEAQVRADGRILLTGPDPRAAQEGRKDPRHLSSRDMSLSSQMALARLQLNHRDHSMLPESQQRLQWWILEPRSGDLQGVPPPQGIPTHLPTWSALWDFRFTLRSDGGVEIPKNTQRHPWRFQ